MVAVTMPGPASGSGYLGTRGASTVVLDPNNLVTPGAWVATFLPKDLYASDFEVFHVALKGPRGGFDVFIDNTFYSTASRSDRNEYDPKNAMPVRAGQTITFHFASAANPQPVVNIFCRQPGGLL